MIIPQSVEVGDFIAYIRHSIIPDRYSEQREEKNNYQAGLAEFLYLIDAAYQLAPNNQEEQKNLIEAFAPSVTTNKSAAASPI